MKPAVTRFQVCHVKWWWGLMGNVVGWVDEVVVVVVRLCNHKM